MNNDELPTNAELASAYLDGELEAAERATAANDPDTMALVDSFTRIRAQLGDIGPVVDSTRTAAMTAALSEFDAIRAATPALEVLPAASNVRSLRQQQRRMRSYRLVSGAAAAAVVVVVGVAALASRGDNSKSSSSAEPATATAAPAEVPAPKALDAAAEAGSAEVFAATAADGAPPIINSAEDLTAYAASIEAVRNAAPPAAGQASTADASALPACLAPSDTVLGAIIFQGIPSFAVRDTDGELHALDATDCRVLIPVTP